MQSPPCLSLRSADRSSHRRRPFSPSALCHLLLASAIVTTTAPAIGAPAANQGEYAGKAVFIRNGVTLDRTLTLERRPLKARENVFVQDGLETDPAGAGRVVMRDRSMLVLAPDSRVELSQYVFKESDPSQDAMTTSVVKGGLRALTGLVDKRNPDRVEIRTPMATIGVRGTAIRVDLIPGLGEEVVFQFGRGFVSNRAGSVEVAEGQGVRVTSPDKLPEFFDPVPNPRDPAEIARRMQRMSPEQAEALARQLAAQLPPAELVVLLGMLEQLPGPDLELVMTVLRGILAADPGTASSMLYTAIRLAEERAPLILRTAVEAGLTVDVALREVLVGLEQISLKPDLLETVLIQAISLGISREDAIALIAELRDAGLCT